MRVPPVADRDIVRISQGWNPPTHYGTDYSCCEGTPIVASEAGVAYPREEAGGGGFGRYVMVDVPGFYVYNAHLSEWLVREGEKVIAGQMVGLSGNTGNSTGPHLHFEVRAKTGSPYYRGAVNPDAWLAEGQEGYVKTTLHCQRVEPWVNDVLRDWRTGWAKVVNPSANLSFPDVPYVLGRIWTDNIDADYLRQGREGGAAFVRDMLPRWRAVPEVTVWELGNEPDCNSNDGLAALNTYTIGAIEEAERQGIRLCVLNLPEGNPHDNGGGGREVEQWKWAQLAPAVKRAVQGGHYVGLHAYWRPGVEGPDGRWHALGRRKWDIETLAGLGVDVARLKVLVNECGIDGGIAGGPAQQGWRNLSNADAYRAEIVEMERCARTIPQIQACMVFTAGFEEPWGGFDVDEGFARSLTAPLRALGSALPISPTPTPIDEEAPVQAYELDAARDRLNRLPATRKACRARGYDWEDEWYLGGFFYCLAWNPFASRYHSLKLETRTWAVVEDVAI